MNSVTIKRTARFKLFEPTQAKQDRMQETMRLAKKAYNRYLEYCRKNKHKYDHKDDKRITNGELHDELYEDIREDYPDLPSALAQTTAKEALQHYRSLKETGGKCRFKQSWQNSLYIRSQNLNIYKSKNTSFRAVASLPTVDGAQQIPVTMGQHQKHYLDSDHYEQKGGHLTVEDDGHDNKTWYANLSFETTQTVPEMDEVEFFVGIDLNVGPLAAIFVQDQYGNVVDKRTVEHEWLDELDKLQDDLEIAQSNKASNWQSNVWDRVNSIIGQMIGKLKQKLATIASSYGKICFIKEELKGLKYKLFSEDTSKKLKQIFGKWPYGQILDAIELAAHELGCAYRTQYPAQTSKTCPNCDKYESTNRVGHVLECADCGVRWGVQMVGAYYVGTFAPFTGVLFEQET